MDDDIAVMSHIQEYTGRGMTAAETLATLEAMPLSERHRRVIVATSEPVEDTPAETVKTSPTMPPSAPPVPPEPPAAVAQSSVSPEIAAWALAGVRSELVSALREAIGDEVRAAVADASTSAEVAQRRGFVAGVVAGVGAAIAAIGAAWAWWGR